MRFTEILIETRRLHLAILSATFLAVSGGTWHLNAQTLPADFEGGPTIDDLVGGQQSNERIVGGTVAARGQWPSMVPIYMERPGRKAMNFCGGTIIGSQWVLTAAHCAVPMKREEKTARFFVREGAHNLNSSEGTSINVTNIVIHPQYNAKLTLNDIALLRLAQPARAPRQKILSQADKGEGLPAGKAATVIGFGLTSEDGNASALLRQVDVPLVSQAECQKIYGTQSITKAAFCAGYKEGGKDSCKGDSGGPIYLPSRNGQQLQIGIVSWGQGCARRDYFGVYASVGHFEQFVRSLVPDVVISDRDLEVSASTPVEQAVSTLTDGATTISKPSTLAQVSVDIVQGQKLKVNSFADLRITSSVKGAIAIFNENPDGRAYQIYPSKAFPAPGADPTIARVENGQVLSVPSEQQRSNGYRFIVKPPLGKNKLRVIVVPQAPKLDALLSENFDGKIIDDFQALMNRIVDINLETRGLEPTKVNPVDRAVSEYSYEIVP